MSGAEIQELKKALRARAREKITALTGPIRAQASTLACTLLAHQAIWTSARVVLVYWPLADEVDVRPLIDEGLAQRKKMVFPRYREDQGAYEGCCITDPAHELRPGAHGVREPNATARAVPFAAVDLALVPGVAFDEHGRRLGRGRGYYDRILAQVRGIKCGVAFDEQILPELPVEAHDALLDYLATPSKFLKTSAR